MCNLIASLFLSVLCNLSVYQGTDYEVPVTWTNDFTIELYNGGGMSPGFTRLFLSTDSCVFRGMYNNKMNVKRFSLTAADKSEILNKLQLFKLGSVKIKKDIGPAYDKSTTSICFTGGGKANYCIQDSANSEIEDADKNRFRDAYNYIYTKAQKKGHWK